MQHSERAIATGEAFLQALGALLEEGDVQERYLAIVGIRQTRELVDAITRHAHRKEQRKCVQCAKPAETGRGRKNLVYLGSRA
jgi:hypothetical protein